MIYIDGKEFAEYVTNKVSEDYIEEAIVNYLLDNENLRVDMKYSEELYSQIDMKNRKFKRARRGSNKGGITISALAALLGIGRKTFSRWAKGDFSPYLSTLLQSYEYITEHFNELFIGKELKIENILLGENLRINVDKYKNLLFDKALDKFLIRIPTNTGQGTVKNRMQFLIWCFRRKTRIHFGIDKSKFDNVSKENWLKKYEILINKKKKDSSIFV